MSRSIPSKSQAWKIRIVLLLTTLVAIGFTLHTPHLNGPIYWTWAWRILYPINVYPRFIAPAILLIFADIAWTRRKTRLAMFLLLATSLSMKFASITAGHSSDLTPMRNVLLHRFSNSYFTDAVKFDAKITAGQSTVSDFIANYPSYMPTLGIHTKIRAPGWMLTDLAAMLLLNHDPNAAAQFLGFTYAILGAASVPLMYWLMRVLARRRIEAFSAAALLAVCAGPALFFPVIDTIYPAMTCAILIAWTLALRGNRVSCAIITGLLLSISLFFTYNLLVLGAMMLLLAAVPLYRTHFRDFPRIFGLGAVVLVAIIAPYIAAYPLTHFPPIATFHTALRLEYEFRQSWHRLNLFSQPWDLYNFALTAGVIPVFLAIIYLSTGRRRTIPATAIASILFICVTSLLAIETMRTWIFLLPLLCVPAGAELARWAKADRRVCLLAMILIAAVLCQTLYLLPGAVRFR